MIRRIKDDKDIEIVIDLLTDFLHETLVKDDLTVNEMHLGRLIHAIIHSHYLWLAEVDGEVAGMLIAIRQPNIWDPSYKELKELAWYVRPQFRSGPAAGRLFFEYCKVADKLKEEKQIDSYVISTLTTTTDNLDLSRRGFKLIEKTYMKE